MNNNILVVGFGAMGCRHVQSLLKNPGEFRIHVVEPFEENRINNSVRINAKPDDIKWYNSVEEIDAEIRLAIIATSSQPRYEIVKHLLSKGIKYFLLEKIVFQSAAQFDEIISLMEKSKAVAYCNFVNRYFNAYKEIRSELSGVGGQLEMSVYGGEFGLGCNAIHYIDLFQFFTNSETIRITDQALTELEIVNRRGALYKEFTGTLVIENGKGDRLNIISEKGYTGGVIINVKKAQHQFILSQEPQTCTGFNNGKIIIKPFIILPTSVLTYDIVRDIFNGSCGLTVLQATRSAHVALFLTFNKVLQIKGDECLCPIT